MRHKLSLAIISEREKNRNREAPMNCLVLIKLAREYNIYQRFDELCAYLTGPGMSIHL